MTKKYDLVIVGAGPGGAMAAKTAGENGLKTAILERKTNPAEITRSCAVMFAIESDYYFAERMFYNDDNGKMIFPVNGFTVDYNGPTRNFYAWHMYAPDGKTRLAFGDYDENIKRGNRGRLSFVYDKGRLIEGLMQEAVKNGVDVFTGVNMTGIEKTTDGVRVTANGETYTATFAVGADGLNSRTAQLMGFNKERTHYVDAPRRTYHLTGVRIPQPEAINILHCHRSISSDHISYWINPCVNDEYMVEFRSHADFEYLTKESIYAKWFEHVKVTRKQSYVFGLWSPVSDPYKDNVLLVGDSTWFAEAEITGSMMCGWKAAHAVSIALRDNRPDREGVRTYIEWWKKSYPEFDDYRNFLLCMLFNHTFSVEELNYLFGLFQKPLRSTLNPFLIVRVIKDALKPMLPQIRKEMPSLAEKVNILEIGNAENIFFERLKKMTQ
jgi:flavin-dependent dehydrogenase